MGIFGGEKYSKETYQYAKSDKEIADDYVTSYPISRFVHDAEKAKKRLEELHGKGQTEAVALNEEYDRLMASTLEAVKALQEFEKNKLGMSEETVH